MKEYTKVLSYITAIGFMLIIMTGYVIFYKMNVSLLQHQHEQFQAESESKINTFNDHISSTTQNFKSYAQLPSFKSMRFYSLTLNDLSAEESRRQLELYFFELHNNNAYLQGVRFISNKGKEIISVEKSHIHAKLYDISSGKNISHVLEHELNANETHIDAIKNDFGTPETLVWWIPVYVSSKTRIGYLAFNVSTTLMQKEMIDISETNLNYIAITNDTDNISQGDHQLISEPLPEHIKLGDYKWLVSEKLPLSGLNWKINIIGDESIYVQEIRAIQHAVNFVLIPTSAVILIILLYMFRKKHESDKKIHHLAYYDSLTGLVNRYQFDDALSIALADTRDHNSQHALLYLDLDQFKVVNDTCGHLAGDKLLGELAAHLKRSVRDSDMLARLGGDEFALLLNLCPEEKAVALANKILETVSDFRFIWNEKHFSIGVSIGVVFINNPNESAGNILRKADLACYMAKELGRNRIHIYTDDDQSLEKRHGEMQWVNRIKKALEEDMFFLVAQRIFPLDDTTHQTQHYEILIRLKENNNVILPGAFIPAAERYGIMPSIDKWVVENTFSFMQKMLASPVDQNKNIIFSINVSGLTLGEKDFYPFIKEQLSKYEIPPESICFEITETAAISNLSVAMDFMDSVKTLGCSLALDDFGTGLSSFTYLKTIPVDYLKIDGSFVTRMLDNPLDMAIIVAIKQISIATKSKVIAEFVVNTEIKDKLQELGIDYAQGYAIAKPIPITQLFKLTDIKSFKQFNTT